VPITSTAARTADGRLHERWSDIAGQDSLVEVVEANKPGVKTTAGERQRFAKQLLLTPAGASPFQFVISDNYLERFGLQPPSAQKV